MRFLALLLLLPTLALAGPWVQCNERYVVGNYHAQECKYPASWCPLISTYDAFDYNATYPLQSQSYWYRITIPASFGIAADVKAVELIGELIISSTNPVSNANMAVFFRAPGAPPSPHPYSAYSYAAQTTVTGVDGVRTPFYVTVPVIGGQFDFAWFRLDAYAPVAGVTYGMNMFINAWCR